MTPTDARPARRIWIAWETQRRSITLSKKVGAELHILDLSHLGVLRFPVSALRTILLLFRNRRGVVFVQNPSMVLATLAALLKGAFGYTLVVDRHTNFTPLSRDPRSLVWRLLCRMSEYTIATADLTIVTNSEIDSQYIAPRGRGFILPDPYPATPLVRADSHPADGVLRVFFVSSWEIDEPIREVVEVCRRMGERVQVYISGRPKQSFTELVAHRPPNFIPTGFLSDQEYFERMASVDFVLAISTWPGTLCCGAYEGLAMGKPLILNDQAVTLEYFSSGALYSDGTVEDLERKFTYAADHVGELTGAARDFFARSSIAWDRRLNALNARIDELHGSSRRSR